MVTAKFGALSARKWDGEAANYSTLDTLFSGEKTTTHIDRVRDCMALYAGGSLLEKRLTRFMARPPKMSPQLYELLKKEALIQYVNHFARVVNYYKGFLFAHPVELRADKGKLDPFWDEFKTDCTGNGLDFHESARCIFGLALQGKDAGVMLQKNITGMPAESLIDWEKENRITLREFGPDDILDLECDEKGELEWIKLGKREIKRLRPLDAPTTIYTFWILDRSTVQIFRYAFVNKEDKPNADTDVQLIAAYEHGFPKVPFEGIFLQKGAWLGAVLAPPQIAYWRAATKESWASNLVAFPQAIVKTDKSDDADIAKIFNSSAGFIIGQDDDFEWTIPPHESFKVLSDEKNQRRNDIYTAGNAEFLIESEQNKPWRSAQAKGMELTTGHISLKSYGAIVRDYFARVFNLAALGRGEDIKFTCGGFEHLDDWDADEFAAMLKTVGEIDFTKLDTISETFGKEARKRLTLLIAPDLQESVKSEMRQEIENAETETAPTNTAPETTSGGLQQALIAAPNTRAKEVNNDRTENRNRENRNRNRRS